MRKKTGGCGNKEEGAIAYLRTWSSATEAGPAVPPTAAPTPRDVLPNLSESFLSSLHLCCLLPRSIVLRAGRPCLRAGGYEGLAQRSRIEPRTLYLRPSNCQLLPLRKLLLLAKMEELQELGLPRQRLLQTKPRDPTSMSGKHHQATQHHVLEAEVKTRLTCAAGRTFYESTRSTLAIIINVSMIDGCSSNSWDREDPASSASCNTLSV